MTEEKKAPKKKRGGKRKERKIKGKPVTVLANKSKPCDLRNRTFIVFIVTKL